MTETFTASNGIEVFRGCQFWFVGKAALSDKSMDALREYFRDERDKELGLWRSRKDPNFIVVPDNLKYEVTVIDEQSGMKQWVTRGGGDGAERSFVVIAEEYFAEHPEKKPWHDAKPGEVWDLTTTHIPNKVTAWSTFDGVFMDSAQNRVMGADILEARRIWPENKE